MHSSPSIGDLLAATAAYYAHEWPFGDEGDAELTAVVAAITPNAGVRQWFDLGNGPTGPLWLPFIGPKRATLSDVNGEHLCYAQHRITEIRAERLLPIETQAAQHAAGIRGISATTKPWVECEVGYATLDLERLQFAPPELAEADLVTAIGALGCLPTEQKLDAALFWLSEHLVESRLVAAFWLGAKAQEQERYAAWPHLYYGDCVARALSAEGLAALGRKHFAHVTTNLVDLGDGRQFCLAEMRNH